jgi:tRNA 2-selenouridine synthase SelU
MSQVHTLTLEAQRPAVVFQREEETSVSPPLDLQPNQEASDTSLGRALGPAPSQHVFEAATVVRVNQTRKFSIIALLVMANVVQVESTS